jgi:hypothetical protein
MKLDTFVKTICSTLVLVCGWGGQASAELLIGRATTTITPDLPVALSGHFATRITKKIETPCTASVVVLEKTTEGEKPVQTILVSCDLVAIREGILEGFQAKLKEVAPEIDGSKIIINATHTHTAPVMLDNLQEIGRRIVRAVDDSWLVAKDDIHFDVPLVHQVRKLDLPIRKVTEAEVTEAKAAIADLIAASKKSGKDSLRKLLWNQKTIDRFTRQNDEPYYSMDLHVVRLGDVALASNPFELFTEYGLRMKARSKALQTFVIQLSNNSGYYLPTEEAMRGGGYSAIVNSNLVGWQGGDILTDETVNEINALWQEEKK